MVLTDEGGEQTDHMQQGNATLLVYCKHFQSGQVRCLGLSSELVIPHIPEITVSHS